MVFMMVQFIAYHASIFLIFLDRIESLHCLAFLSIALAWSASPPSGRIIIPRSSLAW